MIILLNARQERFAQGLAEGKTQSEAYIDAGYAPKNARANASSLLKKSPRILARRDELLERRADCNLTVVTEIAVQAHCTLEEHLSMLARLRDDARAKGDYSSAISAEYKRGQALGFYIQRSEAGKPGDFSDLSDAELEASSKPTRRLIRRRRRSPLIDPTLYRECSHPPAPGSH